MTNTPTLSEAELLSVFNQVIEEAIPAMHGLGIRAVVMAPGRVAGTAPLSGNTNHLGTFYAGALFGLAEMLGGALFASGFDVDRFYPVVKDLQIRFLRPAMSDVRAEASLGEVEMARLADEAARDGRAEFVLEATITDAEGTLVATTTGTYQIRRNRTA